VQVDGHCIFSILSTISDFGVGVSSVTIHVYDLGWKYQDFSTTSVGVVTKKGVTSRAGKLTGQFAPEG
jgi:hypothetical protein